MLETGGLKHWTPQQSLLYIEANGRWPGLRQKLQYKINYDAATFAEDSKVGLEFVIRNSEGLVMASLTQ